LLVVVIGVAYVLAHNVVERLQRRFLVVSGVEYRAARTSISPVFRSSTLRRGASSSCITCCRLSRSASDRTTSSRRRAG
jgi:hypothetical protein